jgi:hypothetical protein
METWKSSAITGELRDVPGIGPAAIKTLKAQNVNNSFQLLATYLDMKNPATMPPAEHQDKFWTWLKEIKIVAHRSAIVMAMGEKMSQLVPGIYDPSVYEEDGEES